MSSTSPHVACPDPGEPVAASGADGVVGSRSRWSFVGWSVAVMLLIGVIVGLVLAVRQHEAPVNIAGLVNDGARPIAPAIPTGQLDGSRLPPLPEGRVRVVNFWASWCGPCRDEAPALQEISKAYGGRGVMVIGINPAAEDTRQDAARFVDQFGMKYTVVRAERSVIERWGVRGYPVTYVVGSDGRLSAHVDGPVDGPMLRTLLDRELADRPPAKAAAS